MMQRSLSEDERSVRVIRALVCLMFLMFAMTTDIGGVISKVIEEYQLSMTAAGAFHYVPMLAIALGAISLGFAADRFGRKRTIIGGLALYGIGSLLFVVGHSFGFFVALLAVLGLGISIFKVGGLALIGDVSDSSVAHGRLMNAAEGFFAIGTILGPTLVAVLLGTGMSWKWLYVIAALLCVVLIAMASMVKFPLVHASHERPVSVRSTLKILSDRYALGFGCLMMLYVAVEVAVYVWMPTYVRGHGGTVSWLPLYALAIFSVLRACGRFLSVWLLSRFHWGAVLAVSGLAIVGCFAASCLGGPETAVWLLPLSGLAMSAIYPTLNSKGMSCFRRSEHGAAAGVLLFFTVVAAAVASFAMGAISDAYGDVRYGFMLATGFAFLLCVGLLYNWLADPARNRFAAVDAGDYGRTSEEGMIASDRVLKSPQPALLSSSSGR